MTLTYVLGSFVLHCLIAAMPCVAKSLARAFRKRSVMIERLPNGLPAGLPDWPGLNCCGLPCLRFSSDRSLPLDSFSVLAGELSIEKGYHSVGVAIGG